MEEVKQVITALKVSYLIIKKYTGRIERKRNEKILTNNLRMKKNFFLEKLNVFNIFLHPCCSNLF